MVFCFFVLIDVDEWIIDFGVFDYMIFYIDYLKRIKYLIYRLKINLFNEEKLSIMFFGEVSLCNNLVFKDVLYVFLFICNLLLV